MPKDWLTQGRFSPGSRFAAIAVVGDHVETIEISKYLQFKAWNENTQYVMEIWLVH